MTEPTSTTQIIQDDLRFLPSLWSTRVPTTASVDLFAKAFASVGMKDDGDYICHFVPMTTSAHGHISFCETDAFKETLMAAVVQKDKDIWRLKTVTNWQKHRLDYQSVYSAYLLGAISEPEFVEEAEKFSSDYREMRPAEIVATIQDLSRLLEFKLSVADYADYLGVEQDAVMSAVQNLQVDVLHLDADSDALKDSK